MGLHTYKICQVLPRDPDQKMGRPPRDVLFGWDGLTEKEMKLMREGGEPRLRPGQIAELDGKIVGRGPRARATRAARTLLATRATTRTMPTTRTPRMI